MKHPQIMPKHAIFISRLEIRCLQFFVAKTAQRNSSIQINAVDGLSLHADIRGSRN
jgi:hypothetical protein